MPKVMYLKVLQNYLQWNHVLLLNIIEAYASIGIDITDSIPVVLNLDNGTGFAPGFIVGDVTYLHFQSGHVPDEVLVREA